MTEQPQWEQIANLGDVNWEEHGGYFVYRDTTGVYPEEAEFVLPEDDGGTRYRFILDRLKMVDGFLVPIRYESDWPHPVKSYDEWFHEDLSKVAAFIGTDLESMRKMLCSENPLQRAEAYRAIGEYHGWENLDHDAT